MTKTQKSEDRFNQIISNAMGVAASTGVGAMSLAILARSVGMSKSGLYAYFNSVDKLHGSMCERAFLEFIRNVITPSREHDDGFLRLKELGKLMVDQSLDDIMHGIPFFAAIGHEVDGVGGPMAHHAKDFWSNVSKEITAALYAACAQGALRFSTDSVENEAPGIIAHLVGTAVSANMLWQIGSLSKNDARRGAHDANTRLWRAIADNHHQP